MIRSKKKKKQKEKELAASLQRKLLAEEDSLLSIFKAHRAPISSFRIQPLQATLIILRDKLFNCSENLEKHSRFLKALETDYDPFMKSLLLHAILSHWNGQKLLGCCVSMLRDPLLCVSAEIVSMYVPGTHQSHYRTRRTDVVFCARSAGFLQRLVYDPKFRNLKDAIFLSKRNIQYDCSLKDILEVIPFYKLAKGDGGSLKLFNMFKKRLQQTNPVGAAMCFSANIQQGNYQEVKQSVDVLLQATPTSMGLSITQLIAMLIPLQFLISVEASPSKRSNIIDLSKAFFTPREFRCLVSLEVGMNLKLLDRYRHKVSYSITVEDKSTLEAVNLLIAFAVFLGSSDLLTHLLAFLSKISDWSEKCLVVKKEDLKLWSTTAVLSRSRSSLNNLFLRQVSVQVCSNQKAYAGVYRIKDFGFKFFHNPFIAALVFKDKKIFDFIMNNAQVVASSEEVVVLEALFTRMLKGMKS